MKDLISDMLTRIRNGQKAFLIEIPLHPLTPKICVNILKVLTREGYIRGFKEEIKNEQRIICVLLKYTRYQAPLIKKIERVSSPGQRIFISAKTAWQWSSGKGCFIISSNVYGIITEMEARNLNIGGEILFFIE